MNTWLSEKKNKNILVLSVISVIGLVAIIVFLPIRVSLREKLLNKTAHPKLPSVTASQTEILSSKKSLPLNMVIPEGAGHVVEGYTAQEKDAKVIIHIQDIHTNYEAQKNLSKMLESLIKENKLKLIMVEGGWGNVSLSYLRTYADKDRRLEVAEEYLKEGKVSGEEYLDIISEHDMILEGLEEETLYKANLDTFFAIEQFRLKASEELVSIGDIVERLKKKLYPPQLIALEKAREDYEAEKISLAEYYKQIDAFAERTKNSLNAYPHFRKFIEVVESEKSIKFPTVEKERTTLIEKLSKRLSKADLTALVTQSLEFRLNKLTPSEYHNYLLEEAATVGLDIKDYPNLEKYVAYIKAHEQIDTANLFDEADELSQKIEAALTENNEQKRVSEISRAIVVLDNFLNLKLVPKNFTYYKAHKGDFITASWIEFLQQLAKKQKVRITSLKPAYTADKNLSTLVRFYDIANDRDDAFVMNSIRLMNEYDEKIAVLIAGGFHTPSLKQKLKESSLSYIVIAPHTTQQTDPEQYRYILKYKSGKEE